MKFQEYLRDIYYDPAHPASYSGAEKLYRAVRKEGKFVLSKAKIQSWLEKQEPYTVHKGIVRKYRRRRIVTPYPDYQWEADVAYMNRYTKDNDGIGYFLLVIDTFSKFVWTVALSAVTGRNVTDAFQRILGEGRQPEHLRTDVGSEFKSRLFQKWLTQHEIGHFYSRNETKAAVAERAIKTIKSKLARYMTKKQTRRWIDILSDVTTSYNGTFHRTIKRTPASVKPEHATEIWQGTMNKLKKPTRASSVSKPRYRFRVGQTVRLSHLRRPFQREYDERWTTEYFIVSARDIKENIPYYKVKDLQGEPIEGTFYGNELSKIRVDDRTSFRIERILRKAGNRVLVKWLGWPKKFNSFIPAQDLTRYSSA